MAQLTQDQVKQALKEAIKEWLDDKYSQFGKWTLRALIASALSSLVSIIIYANWIKVH